MTRPGMVVVAEYRDPWVAEIARGGIEAAGIEARLDDVNLVNANWLFSNAIGGVKLLVPEERADEAVKILRQMESGSSD